MKTLNDKLREEFHKILEEELLSSDTAIKLDEQIVNTAFNTLLVNKQGDNASDLIEKGRAEFETSIINSIKTNRHKL